MTLREEIQKLFELLLKNADKDMIPLLKAYKRSLNHVQDEIAKIYGKYADGGELKLSSVQRISILRELERQLIEQARELASVDVETTTGILIDTYEQAYYRTAYILDSGLISGVSFALLNPEMVKAVVNEPFHGSRFSDRIWKNKNLLITRLREEVEKAIIAGTDIRKLSRAIKKEFEVSAYESKRLLVTEVARVQSEASASIYRQSSVIKRVMYDATLDSRTSRICASLDSKIFDANSNYPKPPLHPNCRSAIIPIVDGWSPTKKRENIKNEDGVKPVVDYQSYDAWAKSKGIL